MTGDTRGFETEIGRKDGIGTKMMRYGPNHRYKRWEHGASMKRNSSDNQAHRRPSKAFEDVRRQNECVKCRKPWNPKHSHLKEDIADQTADQTSRRLEIDESPVDILLKIMKEHDWSDADANVASDA